MGDISDLRNRTQAVDPRDLLTDEQVEAIFDKMPDQMYASFLKRHMMAAERRAAHEAALHLDAMQLALRECIRIADTGCVLAKVEILTTCRAALRLVPQGPGAALSKGPLHDPAPSPTR